jgi:hypothetical protein
MLVIQYPMSDSFDAEEDAEFRGELETLVRDALGAIGTCDGGDVGSGTVNVFCTVAEADATRACKAIVAALDGAGIEGAIIAFIDDNDEDSEPNVLHPDDFAGTFSVL